MSFLKVEPKGLARSGLEAAFHMIARVMGGAIFGIESEHEVLQALSTKEEKYFWGKFTF